jgi:hypothetical protein
MHRIKLLLLSITISLVPVLMVAQPTSAFDPFGDACKNNLDTPTCQQAQNESSDANNRVTGPKNIINTTANILAVITGIGAVLMIIIGGLTMITSGGSSDSVATARRRIIYSLVGLVVVALSWTIIRFITDKLIQ